MIQAVKKGHLITMTQTSKFFYLFLKSIRTLLKIRKRIQLLACKKNKLGKTSQNYTTPTYYKLEILSNCNNSGEIKKKKQKTIVVREGEATFKLVVVHTKMFKILYWTKLKVCFFTTLCLYIKGGVLEDVLASRTHFEVLGLEVKLTN